MTQELIDDLQFMILTICEFFDKYPKVLYFIIGLLFITAIIDGFILYKLNKNSRIYFCCGDDSELCKFKIVYSKKIKGNVFVPDIYSDCYFSPAADDFKKDLCLQNKKLKNF